MIYKHDTIASYTNPLAFSAKGCRRLYLTHARNVLGYAFTGRQISSLSGTGSFAHIEGIEALSYSVKTEPSEAGTLYQVSLSFAIKGIKADAAYLLEALVNSELTAIVQDANFRFHLLGYEQGMISEYEAKAEDGGYTVKMTTRQRHKPEELSAATVADITLSEMDQSLTPSPVYQIPGGGTGGGSGDYDRNYTVTIVTTDNYTLSASDELLLLPVALTVFLPATAEEGKNYIIKADYDASQAPSTVKVTSGDVDGLQALSLDTDRGSVSLVYDGAGSWHTVAYVA